jgi:hypothetical protein
MRLFLSLGLFVLCVNVYAQDSANVDKQDSTLVANQEQRKKLLADADSAGMADSLVKVSLQRQIEDLKLTDKKERERLQFRLDSITALSCPTRGLDFGGADGLFASELCVTRDKSHESKGPRRLTKHNALGYGTSF